MNCWTKLVAIALVVASFAGCGPSLPPVADADKAKAALQAALDAWRDGASEESLQQRQPPIYVNEPDWRTGRKLAKYELGSGERQGQSWRCDVKLTFLEEGRETEPVPGRYSVDTDPAQVVVRE